MSKGEDTRQSILEKGFRLASTYGLEGLSIGQLAKEVGMSKSGLFAHFQSKENMQLAVLESAVSLFIEKVMTPSLHAQRGVPRIRALFENLLGWHEAAGNPGGCIFISAAAEFDDKPGPIKDLLQKSQWELIQSIARMAEGAIAQGHFQKDVDPKQFAFDTYSLILGFHHFHRLLDDPEASKKLANAFEELMSRYLS